MRRFSIAGLMTLTLICALAVAALRDASDAWAGVLFGVTLFLLATSLLGVLQRREAKRAGWQGFAIFGWGYLLLAMGPWVEPSKLATTQWLDALHERISSETSSIKPPLQITLLVDGSSGASKASSSPTNLVVDSGSATLSGSSSNVGQGIAWFLAPGNQEQFRRIGHCLFSLVFALLGMAVGRWFHRTGGTAPA